MYFGDLESLLSGAGALLGAKPVLHFALYTDGDRLQGIASCANFEYAEKLYANPLLRPHLELIKPI